MKLDRDVRKTIEALDWNLHSSNGHLKFKKQGQTLVTGATPSDHRAAKNILSTLAKMEGTTIHGLAEVIAKRCEEQRQRRMRCTSGSTELVQQLHESMPEPVAVPDPEPLYSAEEERLLTKWDAQEQRKQRKKAAKEAEEKRQRALLLPTFIRVVEMGHDLLSRDIEADGGNIREMVKYVHYAINAAADMNVGLRMQGFAASRLLLADYSINGDVRGFVFVIEVSGFYLDPLMGTIEETPKWTVHKDLICECYHEMRLTHNKNYTRYRVSSEWICDRCRALGKPEHKVGYTLLCKRCFKEDPSEVVGTFTDRSQAPLLCRVAYASDKACAAR